MGITYPPGRIPQAPEGGLAAPWTPTLFSHYSTGFDIIPFFLVITLLASL